MPQRTRSSSRSKTDTAATPEKFPDSATAPQTSDRKWTNQEIAALLSSIADILDIQGEIRFKSIAYRRAADVIQHLSRGVQDIWAGEAENLREISGIGEAMSEKLDELFRTGHMSYYEKLTSQVPVSLLDLLKIPGVGPKTVARFWKEFGISSMSDLQSALESGKLNSKGFGEKTIENLKTGIAATGRHHTRIMLAIAYSFAEEMMAELQ